MNTLRPLPALALVGALVMAPAAEAVFLDEERLFKLTATLYTQARVRVEDSEGPIGPQFQPFQSGGTPLNTQAGNLVQWRNYAAPVLEGDVTQMLGRGWLDDFSFRFAGRFAYDGIFDFGPEEFRQHVRLYRRAGRSPLGGQRPAPVFYGTKRVEDEGPDQASVQAARLADQELYDPRDELGTQAEAWEIYVNLQKGPLFLRVGRQNLSWGETDGLRLLDVINPLDRFFGLTFDESLDEQRIPLWMIRANLQIADVLGPIASLGVETFLVPGIVDTTQAPTLYQGVLHPYAPAAGCDAQLVADNSIGDLVAGRSNVPGGCNEIDFAGLGNPVAGLVRVSLYERLPEKKMSNSRFGARFVGVLLDEYTFSLGAYRTWADQPNPRLHYMDPLVDTPFLYVPSLNVVELTHDTVTIVGGTLSFYQSRLVPGVVRAEVGYFLGEAATVAIANFGDPYSGLTNTFVPEADYLRWVIGYDIFELNVPALSATNNLVVVMQWFNSLRLTGDHRFRRMVEAANSGLTRNLPPVLPDRPPPAPLFEDFGRFQLTPNPGRAAKPIVPGVGHRYNAVWNIAVQAFLMHGKLSPEIVAVAFTEGDFGFLPSVIYRFNDAVQVKLGYAGIFGKFASLGSFRDRDQVGVRLTYLLN